MLRIKTMKQFIKIFLSSLLIAVILTPLKSGCIMYGELSAFSISSFIGAIIISIWTIFCLILLLFIIIYLNIKVLWTYINALGNKIATKLWIKLSCQKYFNPVNTYFFFPVHSSNSSSKYSLGIKPVSTLLCTNKLSS